MAAQLRVVRRRIRTVQSTQKITRAFELISASRVVRAQQRVEASRPYTSQITHALTSVANTEVTVSHPLLEPRAELLARLQADGVEPRLYVVGRKGVAYYRFRRRELADSWAGFADRPDYDDAKQVADTMLEAFLDHDVDELHMVYTDFVSMGTQRAVAQRIIP